MENVFRFCLFQFGQICQYDKYICAVISLQNLLNLTLYIMIPPHTYLSTLQSKGRWSLS